MSKNTPKEKPKSNNLILKVAALISLLILIPGLFLLIFRDRIYPGVSVAGVNLTALTKTGAQNKLNQVYKDRSSKNLDFTQHEASSTASASGISFRISLENATEPNIDQAIDQAFSYGHSRFSIKPQKQDLKIEFKTEFESQIIKIAQAIDIPAIDSQLKFEGNEINATPSQDGVILNQDQLKKELRDYLNAKTAPPSTLPLKIEKPKLDYSNAIRIKNRLDELKLSPLTLFFKDSEFILNQATILNLIDLGHTNSSLVLTQVFKTPVNIESVVVGKDETSDVKLSFNQNALKNYLETVVAPVINRPLEEPLFEFDGKRVTEFRAPQSGQTLNIEKSFAVLSQALATEKQTQAELVVDIIGPKNKLANDLGIKELIGSGVSHFSGSIPNRIYNIGLAASRINGVLVAPGDTFSFVNTVGDISGASGYKQAYVIKEGRTVLDDGGGVCQVSTTLFRSVLNSGLPVVKRVAHAYRVGYYEQGFAPGLDATIFSPSVDFQFKNDTGYHILIQTITEGTTLYINLYGTSDGRVTNISNSIITNQTPAPPELRQDDPTLPKGTVKQVDFAANGANVVFTRTVTRGGQTIIQENFRSNYRPWQAIYLVGTQ